MSKSNRSGTQPFAIILQIVLSQNWTQIISVSQWGEWHANTEGKSSIRQLRHLYAELVNCQRVVAPYEKYIATTSPYGNRAKRGVILCRRFKAADRVVLYCKQFRFLPGPARGACAVYLYGPPGDVSSVTRMNHQWYCLWSDFLRLNPIDSDTYLCSIHTKDIVRMGHKS